MGTHVPFPRNRMYSYCNLQTCIFGGQGAGSFGCLQVCAVQMDGTCTLCTAGPALYDEQGPEKLRKITIPTKKNFHGYQLGLRRSACGGAWTVSSPGASPRIFGWRSAARQEVPLRKYCMRVGGWVGVRA